MLRGLKKPQHETFAQRAAQESAPRSGVGKFLGTTDEQNHVVSYRFEAKLKGYVGWEWNVLVFQAKKSSDPTISEVVLLPGKEAIVAPNWIPWSERRAELDKSLLEKSVVSNLEVPEDSEPDAENAGEGPLVRKGLLKRLVKKQNGKKANKPRKGSK